MRKVYPPYPQRRRSLSSCDHLYSGHKRLLSFEKIEFGETIFAFICQPPLLFLSTHEGVIRISGVIDLTLTSSSSWRMIWVFLLILKIKVLFINAFAYHGESIFYPSDIIGLLQFYMIWLYLISLHWWSVNLGVGELHLISVSRAVIQALIESLVNSCLSFPLELLISL